MTQKPLFYVDFGQMPFGNNVAMATPKVPGDRKLLERVCYMLKLNSQSFSFLHITASFWAVLKKPAGGDKFALSPHPK